MSKRMAPGRRAGGFRMLLLAGSALVVLGAPAVHAQTVLTASDASGLVSALNTISSNPGISYTLNITQNITLSPTTTLPAINSTSTVTINGGNTTLDGGGVQRGLFVYSG